MANKQDSNVVGTRIAEELTIGVLPVTPEWVAYEPNSFADTGAQITTVSRNPINESRQRQKGVTTDLDAGAGFNQDWVQKKLRDVLQGFMFADWREQPNDIGPLVGGLAGVAFTPVQYTSSDLAPGLNLNITAHGLITADGPFHFVAGSGTLPDDVTEATEYWIIRLDDDNFSIATTRALAVAGTALDSDPDAVGVDHAERLLHRRDSVETAGDIFYVNDQEDGFQENNLIFTEGFADAANNGLHVVDAGVAVGVVSVVSNLVDEALAPAAAKVTVVGFQGVAGDIDVVAPVGGNLGQYTSTALDFTTLDLVPGAWIFVGGDTASLAFTSAVNNGFKRVFSIAAGILEIDRGGESLVTEASTTETIRIFTAETLKNEATPALIKRRTYQQERTLGDDGGGIQSEYQVGMVPATFQFNVTGQDKITVDMTFLATDEETRTGATGVKSGNRPTLVKESPFNTTSDFTRIKLTRVSTGLALFAFVTEFTVTLDNTISPNKAVSVLGAFDMSAGQFVVSASITAYFNDLIAKTAVRNNEDTGFDFAIVKENAGWVWDMPLVTLGDARLNVEQDAPITLPLTLDAGADTVFDHTMLLNNFVYLPNAAQ